MPINQTIIEGNITKDGELRVARTGNSVLNFTVAHNTRRKNPETGEWEDGERSFFRCVLFGRQADRLARSIVKGARVLVQGKLRQREYEKDGERKSVYEIVVDEIFLGRLPEKDTYAQPQEAYEPAVYDEDLPF